MDDDLLKKYGLENTVKDVKAKRQDPYSKSVYSAYDESGKHIGNITVQGTGNAKDLVGKTAYRSGDGTASLNRGDFVADTTGASISLDKNTGKITVKAPDVVLNNETFKKSLDPVLKSLSLNYKLNPNYKYALVNTEEGKKNVKTTEEWVKELNDKDLPQLVGQAIGIEDTRRAVKEQDGVDLTDEQIIKMSQTGTNYVDKDGKEHLAKDTDMVGLPKSMFEGKGLFAGIKGWDENTHMITRKDLLAKYDRTKSSDEDILDVFKEVDDYFKKGDFSDADEYAEMSSLRSFINGQDPNTDFLHNIKDFGEATVAGIGTGGYGLLTDTASFIEGALNIGRRGFTKASLAVQGRGDEINDEDVVRQNDSVFFKELSEEKDKWENSIREDYAKLSDVKAGGYSVGSVALPLVGQIALAVVTGGAASGAVGNTATKIASKWGAKAIKLGSLADDAITASQNTGKVANLARNAYAGTEIALTMSNPAIANTAISESINALRIANRAQTIGKVAATGADLAAQITVDVALSNPRLARQFLDGDVTDENKAYMYEQLAWNVGGWGAGAAGMKAFKAVGSSDIGKVANAAITPKMYGVQADIGQRIDDFKTLLHKGDPDWLFKKMEKAQAKSAADVSKGFWGRQKWNNAGRLERKQSALTSNRLVREAKRTFSQQDSVFSGAKSWDDLVENAKRIKKAQVDTVGVANLVANKGYKVNVQSINERLASENTAFRSARNSYMDQLAKVNKLEDASKLARAGEASLSDDVNKYVNAMHRMDQANAELRLGKVQNQLVGAQKELDHLQEVVDGLRRKLSPELRQEADNLLMEARKLSGATQDLRVKAGVLDEDELAAMRNSGYFDHGYLRQQRVQEWNEYTRRGEEGIRFSEMRDPQHFNWGNTEDDWQDLSVVLFDDINQVSRQVYRKEMTDMLEGLGHKVDVVVSGKDVAMVRKVSPLRKEAIKSIDQNTKRIVSAGDDDVFSKIFQKKGAESLINTQASKTVKSGGKVAKAKAAGKTDKQIFDAQTLYKENIEKLNALKKQYDIPEMNTDITKAMDDLVNEAVENNKKNTAVSDALKALDEGNADDLVEYATLKSLSDKSNLKEAKASFKAKAKREFNKFLTENNTVVKDGKKVKKLTGAQIDKLSKQWADEGAEWLEETIMQRYGNITNKLRESGSDIVDTTDVFSKIDALNQEITGAAKRSGEALNVIKTYDGQGREEWVELSPTIADMITTMPRPMARGAFGELQQHLVRLFRMGTTGGLMPSSLIRQAFRDTGSALTVGGATRSMRATEREFERIFGEYLGDIMQREMPDVWDSLLRESQETGETMARTFARRETARGAANIADSQLESSLYRFTQNAKNEANAYRYVDRATGEEIVLNRQNTDSLLGRFQEKLEKAYDKTELANNVRESYLRKRTYNNALQQGLADGMGLERARKYAEFVQAEATTNFGRQTYYLANLTKTVPYLGAAINGAKSFWRLWAFDPVGATTRIIGGYVVPSMALLAVSLGDPENRRIYEGIPEYEKTDNLIFVVQGQKFTIPIPQEVSSFIRPLQSMVESMAGANDHSLTELLVNDLVGFMPLNLEGFVNIDADRILLGDFEEDPAGYVLRNHIMPGFTKMSSQLMPPLVKSGYILATGYDPYTGKKVDTSYTAVDPETGESIVMGGNVGDLAKGLATIFGDSLSPQMAQAVLGNLLGSGNMDIIDGITGLVTATAKDRNILSGVNMLGGKLANQVTKPLFSERYNEQSNLAWNRATGKLRLEKKELMNDEELQADIKAINTDNGQLSEKARKEILGRIRSKTEGFQRKVVDAANDLVKNYDGGIIDKNKLATVLDLATFSEGENLNLSNMYAQKLEREEYTLANAAAIESLANLGFKGAGDSSIFGYYKKNKDGNVEFVRNDPMTILNYERSSGVQDKMALAEIESLVKEAGLWDKHDAIYKQINKIRGSKKKLSKSDFATIDAIKINWNAELMKTLAPVVKRMTPEAAINNKAVRDFLYSYVEVPGEWSVNNKGRHPSLGERGSTKGAYYQSWLKSMYGIKDQYKGQY